MNAAFRRGACPALSQPMATGDGLLVRLTPTGVTIPCEVVATLCRAAHEHGNGIVEVTSRGNIQVRGLTETSLPAFAAAVGDMVAYFAESVPVTGDPLAGLDADELIDAHDLAADLREAIGAASFAPALSAKVSVTVDGGGALHLDALAADVRLRALPALGGARLHIAVGGDAHTATPIGVVAPDYATNAVLRILGVIAARGPAVRARDIVATEDAGAFRRVIADIVLDGPLPAARTPSDPIGTHALRDGTMAFGVGLAFGHADAGTLARLADAAADCGACGTRMAPDRALIAIGIPRDAVPRLQTIAEQLGLIVHRDDPRRRVVACAGAPICASAEIPSRALAPILADLVASMRSDTPVLHISGCAKGCACPRAMPITIVGIDGRCGVIVNGCASDAPIEIVTQDALPGALARLADAACAMREEARIG